MFTSVGNAACFILLQDKTLIKHHHQRL